MGRNLSPFAAIRTFGVLIREFRDWIFANGAAADARAPTYRPAAEQNTAK